MRTRAPIVTSQSTVAPRPMTQPSPMTDRSRTNAWSPMIVPRPMRAPANTIAWAQIAAPSSITSGAVVAAPAIDERGLRVGALPRIAPSWTTTPSPITTSSWTTTCAPKRTPSPTWAVGLSTSPGAASPVMPIAYEAVTAAIPRQALRGAVLGLGMIGRHHARLLQNSLDVDFVGAVDPDGDRFGAVHDPAKVFASAGELPEVDFAIVAVPTEGHLNAVRTMAARGAHLLIEKPLASTSREAQQVIDVVRESGVRAAVGHVERFNPALIELRRRFGELGEVLLIRTE